jgi:hypothetical protein
MVSHGGLVGYASIADPCIAAHDSAAAGSSISNLRAESYLFPIKASAVASRSEWAVSWSPQCLMRVGRCLVRCVRGLGLWFYGAETPSRR